ncbi:MAG: hypothetical protein RLZZ245_234 [Verrucomicrobiota bacterium]|jgi:hypothetical protein
MDWCLRRESHHFCVNDLLESVGFVQFVVKKSFLADGTDEVEEFLPVDDWMDADGQIGGGENGRIASGLRR